MIAAIMAVTRMDTLEWLSMQNLPVLPLAWLFVGTRDHSRLGASLWNRNLRMAMYCIYNIVWIYSSLNKKRLLNELSTDLNVKNLENFLKIKGAI